MTHRADQILTAIAVLVAARVEPKGVHVYKHRRLSLDLEQDELQAISVDYGEDRPAVENTSYIDSVLTVQLTAVVAAPEERDVREKLLAYRRECHIALMADVTLGLDFVIVTEYGGALEPSIDVDGEQPVGELTSVWLVTYRMNRNDPGD